MVIESDNCAPANESGESVTGGISDAKDGFREDDGLDDSAENCSTQLCEEFARFEDPATSSWPEKDDMEADPTSDLVSWSCTSSMLDAMLDSEGGGLGGSEEIRDALDFDCNSCVTPSTSSSSRICSPSVGMSAMIV